MTDSPSFGDLLHTYVREKPQRALPVMLRKKENLYMCGEYGDCIYLIADGHVKTVALAQSGKGALLGIYSAGDIVGESCLLATERQETAIAMADVRAVRIYRRHFLEALAAHGLFESYLRYLTGRLYEQQQYMTFLVTCDSEQRLAASLLRLAGKSSTHHSGWVLIEQKLTHEELAAMVGTTRSRIGYFLKRLRENSLVGATSDSRLAIHRERLSSYLELSTLRAC